MKLFLFLILMSVSAEAKISQIECYPINKITPEQRVNPGNFSDKWEYFYENSGWDLAFDRKVNTATDSGPETEATFHYTVTEKVPQGTRTQITAQYDETHKFELNVSDEINVEGNVSYLSKYKVTTNDGVLVREMTLACDQDIAQLKNIK